MHSIYKIFRVSCLLQVKRIRTCPENSTIFQIHLAILELEDPVTFTKWVQPACLWCESDIDLKNIIGQSGSVSNISYVYLLQGYVTGERKQRSVRATQVFRIYKANI